VTKARRLFSLPNLAVVREITMEGEAIPDALPDPNGRYLSLDVGRHRVGCHRTDRRGYDSSI
jgi:hypothetical protein